MRQLLLLCTKRAHFTLKNKTYLQIYDVAMGLPLVPALYNCILLWKRYIDDTIDFLKLTSINKALETLNSYHKSIKFTTEIETDNKILFLDVLLIRNNSLIRTEVYRKNLNTGIYINWK